MTARTRLTLFHLFKLQNALLALASLIQKWNFFYSKKIAISAEIKEAWEREEKKLLGLHSQQNRLKNAQKKKKDGFIQQKARSETKKRSNIFAKDVKEEQYKMPSTRNFGFRTQGDFLDSGFHFSFQEDGMINVQVTW